MAKSAVSSILPPRNGQVKQKFGAGGAARFGGNMIIFLSITIPPSA